VKKSTKKTEASKKSVKNLDDQEIKYNNYIKQVLKQLHPTYAITKEAMASMSEVVLATIEMLAKKAGELSHDHEGESLDE